MAIAVALDTGFSMQLAILRPLANLVALTLEGYQWLPEFPFDLPFALKILQFLKTCSCCVVKHELKTMFKVMQFASSDS